MAARSARKTAQKDDAARRAKAVELFGRAIWGSMRLAKTGRHTAVSIDQKLIERAAALEPDLLPAIARGEFNFCLKAPPGMDPTTLERAARAMATLFERIAAAWLDPALKAERFPVRKPTTSSGKRLYQAARRHAVGGSGTTELAVRKALRAVVTEGCGPWGSFTHSDATERPPSDSEQCVLIALHEARGTPLQLRELMTRAFGAWKEGDPKTLTSRAIPVLKRRGWITNIRRQGYRLTDAGRIEAARLIDAQS